MDWPIDFMALSFGVLLLLAAWTDFAIRLIPDSLSIAVGVLGAAMRLMVGAEALMISIGLAVAFFLLLLLLHARGALGGGDVKLAAAICLGLSPISAWHFIVVTALAGGVLSIVHLIARRALRGTRSVAPAPSGSPLPLRVLRTERWRISRNGSLSYGVAIACGGIWAMIESRWF